MYPCMYYSKKNVLNYFIESILKNISLKHTIEVSFFEKLLITKRAWEVSYVLMSLNMFTIVVNLTETFSTVSTNVFFVRNVNI